MLRVVVADKGCGIEDVPQAMQPMFTTGGPERAGLGFAVMESFMDRVKVPLRPEGHAGYAGKEAGPALST